MLLVVGAILAGSIIVALGAARVGVPSLVVRRRYLLGIRMTDF